MSGTVHELKGEQRAAVDPRECVWLSASAGTGKTQVLSARVLRLLLEPGTDPSQILCLTFTKAGAAEMAVRVNEVLAQWVRADDAVLATDLGNLGAPIDAGTRERARTLFASVLDCPGGGLRIDTIHAFAQWLLANFPGEAGILPGTRPMEDRERELLFRDVLADMLGEAERWGDAATLDAVAEFTIRKDPDSLRRWLMRCAGAHDLWFGSGAWQPPMKPQVLRLLGMPADADAAWVAEACSDAAFPMVSLRACIDAAHSWKAKSGQDTAEFLEGWTRGDPAARLAGLDGFFSTLLKKDGEPRKMGGAEKADPAFPEHQQAVAEAVRLVADRTALLELADFLAPSLEIGRKFALAWDAAKQREGLIDFDDLIQRAADLLSKKEMAPWIRFKLDRRFEHILVDEAQDTNAAQWQIIDALIDDFFAGEGAHGDKLRTIFTVGDYKQAIFGFQGTSPENFAAAKERVRTAMNMAADNAEMSRSDVPIRRLQDPSLNQSFRSSKTILEFVDRAIEAVGWQAIGLSEEPDPHVGQDRPGLVELWQPVRDATGDEEDEEGQAEDSWLSRHDRLMADKIATQVRRWMDTGFPLVKDENNPRHATPGDVMVLVRKRKELASLIVARLHAKGVPVAGVDRLRLGAPLAVKDLMAAVRFAAQPLDDLNLANLLVSPLIGWSQEDLLAQAYRGTGERLWHHLRGQENPLVAQTVDKLRQVLARADFEPPQALLHWLLVGPWQGRRKLVARLGSEANDPIDELLNAGFAYEAVEAPSLAGFIRWFDAGEGELKRDAGEAADLVRVMTVHGSKGLQAPIVILADATGKPGQGGDLTLEEPTIDGSSGRAIPLPGLSQDERRGPIAKAHDAASADELREHWRLLYVAMTRAEEALFIGGSLSAREKAPHEDSWFARLEPLFEGDMLEDGLWGAIRRHGELPEPISVKSGRQDAKQIELPAWLHKPIGPEPQPPRPLAPSSAGEEKGADPPLPPDVAKVAARRGVLIHRLLERLPDIGVDERADAADAWLARQASDLADEARAEIARCALAVLEDPAFAEVFGPGSLAEIPLAANIGKQVVAGTADRLLVTAEKVVVVDFKTARRPPQSLEEIPDTTVNQMAAYVAALEAIYPGKAVEAAVLYTQTPRIFAIPPEKIEAGKARFSAAQESYPALDIE